MCWMGLRFECRARWRLLTVRLKVLCFLFFWLEATYDQLTDSIGWSGVATVLPRGISQRIGECQAYVVQILSVKKKKM